jgi:hypothetical protein
MSLGRVSTSVPATIARDVVRGHTWMQEKPGRERDSQEIKDHYALGRSTKRPLLQFLFAALM